MDIDFDKFEKDLVGDDKEAVKSTLLSFFDTELSPADRGEILMHSIMVYTSVKNDINEAYLNLLKDTIASLKEVDRSEETAGDAIEVEDIRKRIADL